jgi:hypothetical protein
MLGGMQPPIFVRRPSDDEQQVLADGLRSAEAFVLRRCQIILASARGERAPQIARALGCDDQTVRNVITGFDAVGLMVLARPNSRSTDSGQPGPGCPTGSGGEHASFGPVPRRSALRFPPTQR